MTVVILRSHNKTKRAPREAHNTNVGLRIPRRSTLVFGCKGITHIIRSTHKETTHISGYNEHISDPFKIHT